MAGSIVKQNFNFSRIVGTFRAKTAGGICLLYASHQELSPVFFVPAVMLKTLLCEVKMSIMRATISFPFIQGLYRIIYGTLLKFIVNYLQGREQCVAIGACKSAHRPVTSGVPQGSIRVPLFFVLFINDMMECVSEGTTLPCTLTTLSSGELSTLGLITLSFRKI